MKTLRFNLMITVFVLCLSLQVNAQKPQIQVSFDIAEDTSIHIAFEDDINELKRQALDTLVKGLNNYIGFLSFTTESAANKLEFTLNEKIEAGNSDDFMHEYWLFFKLTNTLSAEPLSHQCKFLGINEIEGVLSHPEALLNKLGQVWTKYLQAAYNVELVSILFDEVALNLPKSLPYIDNFGDIEAILPFKKEMLKMDPDNSKFKVVIEGTVNGQGPKKSTNEDAHFSRIIAENMPVHDSLIGCILIEFKDLPQMTPSGGVVYITHYRWEPYSEAVEEEDNEFDDNN